MKYAEIGNNGLVYLALETLPKKGNLNNYCVWNGDFGHQGKTRNG